MNQIENILSKFPKIRSELPPEYKKIYKVEYKENRDGIGIIGSLKAKLENWMHFQISKLKKERILEVGAGTLNHIPFENNYLVYDVIEPMSFLYEHSDSRKLVNNFYKTSEELKDNELYTNIISIAVFEHMTELPLELTRLIKHMKNSGVMQLAIPTEGSFVWYLSWRFVTGTSFYLKHKLDYKPFMKHEHVNKSIEIEKLMKYVFNDVKIVRFPLNLFHLSFYTYIEARNINIDAVETIANFYEK